MRNLTLALAALLLSLLSACAGPRLVSPTTKAELPEPSVSIPRDILCDT